MKNGLLFFVFLCCSFAVQSEVVMSFEGLVANGNGSVAHGEVNESPVYISNTSSWGNHPLQDVLTGVYSELCSPNVFNFTTGEEHPENSALAGQLSKSPAGHNLASLAVTTSNGNQIYQTFFGFTMDTSSAGDYQINSSTLIENRIYRNGTVQFFEEVGTDNYVQVLEYTNAILTMAIDYNTQVISMSITGNPSTGVGDNLPEISLNDLSGSSVTPIQVDGTTTEGRYAQYDSLNITATFGEIITLPLNKTYHGIKLSESKL